MFKWFKSLLKANKPAKHEVPQYWRDGKLIQHWPRYMRRAHAAAARRRDAGTVNPAGSKLLRRAMRHAPNGSVKELLAQYRSRPDTAYDVWRRAKADD